MLRTMLKSKISQAVVTQAELYYKGSISIDEKIMNEADLLVGEKVQVLNVNNGSRFETYVIKGEPGSGVICLNGPAARLGCKGDTIMIISYGMYTPEESKELKTKYVELDGKRNQIANTYMA
jgi:aspartate 1-decarboxylase